MAEKREMKRRQLIYYLRVFNMADGSELGHLVDVTTEGALILTTDPVEPGVLHTLKIDLFAFMSIEQEIVFKAECVRSEPDVNREYYDSGFRFTGISRKDRELIERLIRQFGFDN